MKKKTSQLPALDRLYLWHPFTQMQDWLGNEQLIIEKGQGSYLYDTNGKKYLDGVSSLWVTVHGHRKKELNQAIKKQLDKIAHSTLLGLSNSPAIELAKQLVKIAPQGLEKVFYSDNGSTAVEIALKIAFQFWQQAGVPSKTKFLTLENAYHGDTIGSVSVGGIDLFHKIYQPLLFSSYKVATNLKAVEQVMKKHHLKIAAMIVEPLIQGAAGMLLQPKGFLRGVRQLCTKYNILLICDEVATGFGRTGKMFACQHEGVSPDILCLAKGLTGGYLPLAATLTTSKIFNAFLGKHQDQKTFFHGHTYTGNPLACAAALANLEIFKKEQTIRKLRKKIQFLTNRLKGFALLESAGEIRQCGLMVGIELVKNKTTKEPFPYEDRVGHQVILEARQRGLILRPLGDVIVLMPPLSISLKELGQLLDIAQESIIAVSDTLKKQPS